MSAQICCPIARLEKLLLATDGSAFSEGAIREAIGLAKICSSKIYAVSVIELNPEFLTNAPGLVEKYEKEVRQHLESVKSRATKENLDCEIIVHEGEPFQYIVDEASEKQVEMIIMGRHGRTGLTRLLMGSVTAKVIGHTQHNVLVVPENAAFSFQKVLIVTDGSRYSESAAREGISIAKRCGSDLIALSVATENANLPSAKENVDKVVQAAEKEGMKLEGLTLQGTPYEVIVDTVAKKKADMIVIGSHGRTGLERLLMGSVTERVIGHAGCAVLVVKKI